MSKGSYPFSRELGWSHSRYEKFTTCRRQYWYSYYGKHDREFGRARIDKLKNLTSVAIEKGTGVHDVIDALFKRLQKTAELINRERMTAFSEARVREVVRNKRFGRKSRPRL